MEHEYYGDILANDPQRAVRTVKMIHNRKDIHAREGFAAGFICKHTDDEKSILVQSGMPELLLDIALQEDTYRFFEPLPGRQERQVLVYARVRYAIHVLSYLSTFLKFMAPSMKSDHPDHVQYRRCIDHITSTLPSLWKMVWENRRLLFQDPLVAIVVTTRIAGTRREVSGFTYFNIMDSFLDFILPGSNYRRPQTNKPPSSRSYEARLLLFLFVHRQEKFLKCNVIKLLFLQQTSYSDAEVDSMVKQVLEDDRLAQSLATETFCFHMRHLHMGCNCVLQMFHVFAGIIQSCDGMIHASEASELPAAIFGACQQLICSEDYHLRATASLRICTNMLVGMMHKDHRRYEDAIMYSPLRLLPAVMRMMVPTARRDDEDFTKTTIWQLLSQWVLLTKKRPQPGTRESWEKQQRLREGTRYLRNNWLATLDALREVTESEDSLKARDRLIWIWQYVGHELGFDEDTERKRAARGVKPEQIRLFLPAVRCHWSPCLCALLEPSHKMRVCKGCWKVYYCSKLCQEEDWKTGHKQDCKLRGVQRDLSAR